MLGTAEELVENFDIHDPRLVDCFYETLERMRRKGPVHFSSAHGGHWIVVGHEEVTKAARDWRRFSSAAGVVLAGTKPQKFVPVEYDPPQHQAFRRLLNPHFSSEAAEQYEADLRRFANRLIDDFEGRGSADLSADYAKPMAAHFFFTQFLAFSAEDAALCEAATNQAMFSTSMEEQLDGFKRLDEIVRKIVDSRRGQPSNNGFIDTLRTSEVDGRPVTEEELIGMIQLLIVGGDDTAVHTIGNILLLLGRNPLLRDRLRQDFSLFPSVMEESIRHMPPAVSIMRTVTQDTELGGQQMRAGEKVLLVWPSANRDEAVFEDADHFLLDRPNVRKHIAFGGGVHKCIGEWFARSIVSVATRTILDRIPDFEVPKDARIEYRMGQSRGPTKVPAFFSRDPSR